MGWEDVGKIVLCALASVGGISGIIVLAVKFSSNMIAERLSQRYELKMQKELEKYKSGLDNKIYITKAKFDAEFALYRDLSKAFFQMVKDITIMIPAGYATYPADEEKRKEYEDGLYAAASQSTVAAQDVLNSNVPFIPENLYQKYDEIMILCRLQLREFQKRWNVLYFAPPKEKESFSREDYQRSRDIQAKFSALNHELREYLGKLDVLE